MKILDKVIGLVLSIKRRLRPLIAHIFQSNKYYLFEHNIKESNKADFMPAIEDFTFKIITTSKQLENLVTSGFDFKQENINFNFVRSLDMGAIAFCIFIRQKLAHVGWIAMTEKAKNTFESLPYHIDFSNGQACTGGTVTVPRYRGKGLMAYSYFKRFQFLKEKGVMSSRSAVSTRTIAAQRVHARFCHVIYGQLRHLKILFWESWRETLFEHGRQLDSRTKPQQNQGSFWRCRNSKQKRGK